MQDAYSADTGTNTSFTSGSSVVFNHVWIRGSEKACFNLTIFSCDKYGVPITNCEAKVRGAGGNEAIFTIQALRDQVVPPTLNLHHPDEEAAGLNLVALQARPQKMRYALSNGFGFGGVNASLLLKRWQ